MWLISSVIAVLALSSAWAAPSSSGPTSESEAQILWQDGRTAYESGKFEEAVPLLQRFVDRYAAAPGYTDAHLALGRSYLELGKAEKAIPVLRYYVKALGKSLPGLQGRIVLGDACAETGNFDESALLANEVLSAKDRSQLPQELWVSALLLKARAQLGLTQEKAAERTLESTRKYLESESAPLHGDRPLRGQAQELRLRMRLVRCQKLPSAKKLDEAQVRSETNRRGDCLLEATNGLLGTYEVLDAKSSALAQDEYQAGARGYVYACTHPPRPVTRRSQTQLKTYMAELMHVLRDDCQAKLTKSLEIVQTAKDHLPKEAFPRVETTLAELKKIQSELGR